MLLVITDNVLIDNISDIENMEVYNLSSLKEGYPRLDILPTTNIYYQDERQFDIDYFNWIFNNDHLFKRLFKIIYSLYIGNNVVLLISNNEGYNVSVHSILKIIQQRYGYNSIYINDMYDLNFISDISSDFSLNGLYNLDIDKSRYTQLLALAGELE